MKKILSALLIAGILLTFAACGSNGEKAGAEQITIAYQGGIGYAPVHILEAKSLIQENYKQATGEQVEVTFQKLDSGADINTGIIGGTIDIGCMGIAPAVSAVSSGVPAKVLTGLCSQTHGLMTNDPSIKTLSDIGSEQIALVNIGSIQHILLAMAAEKELGDAHALDSNIVKMSHAEGFAALEAGTYKLHLTSSPFINRERENEKFTEITAVNEIWPDGNTFLVALASTSLQAENEALFNAVTEGFAEAITFINENEQEAAEIIAGYLSQDVETTLSDLQDETCMFFPELKGATQMAEFMFRAEFIEKEVDFAELTFSNVKGN
ncbi:MAG: ABC transporter substrate-binding protein [Clostridia bacterium]|nr:ABC transporter substrate-binding protein [Clostridia bacterium]